MTTLIELQKQSKEELVNRIFNNLVCDIADAEPNDCGFEGDKLIPYVGWYWRDTNFVERVISIGDCGYFIGVMENNKWDYPERLMTKDEADKFINNIEKVINAKDTETKNKILKENWDWFQTLKI